MAEDDSQQPAWVADAVVSNVVDASATESVIQAHTITGGVHVHRHEYRLVRPVTGLPHRFGAFPPRAGSFRSRAAAAAVATALGRGDAMEPASDGGSPVGVLSGLGGVGKTQLAVDYAETVWANGEVDVVAWVTAASQEEIVSRYARLAVDLLGIDDVRADHGAQRFLEWLAGAGRRWLIVLDDVQRPADLNGLWPPVVPHGRTLVTTRRRDAALRGYGRRLIEVGVFTEAEARSYLRDALGGRRRLLDGAAELAAELGFLPLALAQAAAFMIDRDMPCANYRRRLAERRRSLATLLPEAGGLPDEQRATVAATWSISVEQADRLVPVGLARPLLAVASFLDANGVPLDVFRSTAVLEWLATEVSRDVPAEQAIDGLGCLRRLSLASWERDSTHPAVRVHALVQRAIRDSLSPDRVQAASRCAADALLQIWPDIERETELGQALRANAGALAATGGEHLWRPDPHGVLVRAGHSLGESGQVAEARNYYQRLHETAIGYLGADHPHTLTVRHWLAHWRGEAGHSARAAAEFQQLLIDDLRVRGADHPWTLDTRFEIAYRRGQLGDPAGAAAAFEQLLADYTRVFGAEDTHTLTVRHQLANWRGRAGDPDGAVTALTELLADRVRVLGADHFKVLYTRHRLAYWRGRAGDAIGAVAAFQDLLADASRVLGTEHPHTLFTRYQIACWRGDAGDSAGAAASLEELFTDYVRILGPDHPDTLTVRQDLAHARGQMGDPAGAVARFEEVLADRVRVLGADHPKTRSTRDALLYWKQRWADAEPT